MRNLRYSKLKKIFLGLCFLLAVHFSWSWAVEEFEVYSSQDTIKMRGSISDTKDKKRVECEKEMTYDSLSREISEGLKRLEEINNKIKEATQKVEENEKAIEKARNLLKKAHEEGPRQKIIKTIRTLEEVKEKNIQSTRILDEERKKVLIRLTELEVKMRVCVKGEERLPPYFSGDVPPVNCEAILREMSQEKRERCYCPTSNRAPLCFSSKEEKESYLQKVSLEKKTYICYWKAEAIRIEGGHGISDGTYLGRHGTYEEAWEACKKDAERTMELGDFKILNFECFCYE